MRLIYDDKLIARLKQLKGQDILANLFISDVIKVIKQMPTAYDIDKVVEEFDKKYNNALWIKGNEEFSITRNELIEIVKQGGVADDVCEWRCYIYGRWHTECHTLSSHNPLEFKYCPYCGKKIKVVE